MSTNYVPAIKAKMGDWVYYITKMKFGEVEKSIELAEKIHPNRDLDELIQRDLSARVESMTEFLLKEPQRFYGSLVVAIYKGNPVFRPIKISENNKIVDEVSHAFGLLQMDGSQTYFALDGQHRLESIKAACSSSPDLRDEEISVIILQHENSKIGMQRTRRLFTKLNRYAKPTDEKTNISLDEDDAIAIVTRQLIREYEKFKGIIKIDTGSKQLSRTDKDKPYLMTMRSLYECNVELAKSLNGGLDVSEDFLSRRPSDEFLDDLYRYLVKIYDELFEQIDVFKKVLNGTIKPGVLRQDEDGGSIWARPNVHLIISEVIKDGLLEDHSITKVIASLKKLPSTLSEEPWVRVIYNPGTKNISGGRAEREFLVKLIGHVLGISSKATQKELKESYGAYHERKTKELPQW